MAAQRGINVGDINQASQTFTAAPRNQPKPKPKPKPKPAPPPPPKPAPPVKKNTVTLKPLVNRKGKVVGYGHFKGDEVQDRSKIPTSAPKTPAAKQKLAAAVAATPKNQITPAAQKKQAEVVNSNMPKLTKAQKKFNQYIRSLPTDGSAGDINQISRSYIESGQGGAALQNQLQDDSAQRAAAAQQAALEAQQKRLADLQAQRNEQARQAAAEAARQAAIAEARRKQLEAQRTVGSASGRGGLKLTGVKERSQRATRRSRRQSLSSNQLNLNKRLASLLKVGNLNLG